jgi:hypothetical protein
VLDAQQTGVRAPDWRILMTTHQLLSSLGRLFRNVVLVDVGI